MFFIRRQLIYRLHVQVLSRSSARNDPSLFNQIQFSRSVIVEDDAEKDKNKKSAEKRSAIRMATSERWARVSRYEITHTLFSFNFRVLIIVIK